jgi:hypothetical protein
MRLYKKELLCWVCPTYITHPEQTWTGYIEYTINYNAGGKTPIFAELRDESEWSLWHDFHVLKEGGTGNRSQYYGWQFSNASSSSGTLLIARLISGSRNVRPILFFEK